MKKENNICPPCGENVAAATKRGANKVGPILPLLPRLTAVLPPQGREMFHGFTLIELLVVVLIIGILAAVAVPQYQKAVKKTKYAQMMVWVKKIGEAQTLYYLEHGTYTTSLEELGFTVPTSETCTAWLSGGPLWKIEDMCIGIVNKPNTGVVWGSLGPKYYGPGLSSHSDWNGYAYLQTNYGSVPAKQLICMESRNPGKEDPHCTGTKVRDDAYGKFYTVQ